ncbi:hypothetical protein [Tahibacter amnicola]|uniref:Clan AA aspartic protease (TIGR02281 family) n=1 Tax=Tahibacter amnicola TaxID=2976241 RepID=A0ABY6BJN5_9GAMM|nr:hypothetical protein [Tahibacter amnicola]UXI70233.1 hypothetical protein N4264_11540 [Tahibacter amnicola]
MNAADPATSGAATADVVVNSDPVMTYDIGVGRCVSIDGDMVVAMIDSAVLMKLLPGQRWQRFGKSRLLLSPAACSRVRPPVVDQELFVDRAAIAAQQSASVDVEGDGVLCAVHLGALLENLDPQRCTVDKPKKRVWEYRGPRG